MVSFGQMERMGTLFAAIEGRNVRGTAGSQVSVAREGYMLLSTNHEMATFSGPAALVGYLSVSPTRSPEQSRRTIYAYHSPMTGTSLADLHVLARDAGLGLEMVHLSPMGDIPVPSIVHLKSQHYSVVIGEKDGRYVIRDPALGGLQSMSGAALRDEATGYLLVSPALRTALGARVVRDEEAAAVLGHCQPGGPAANDPPCPNCGGGGPGPGGMPSYSFHPQKVSLIIDDVPLGYTPPVGAPINFHLSYDHRENRHPQTFNFGHVGPMWSHNWLSYVTEGGMWVTLRGIGQEAHLGMAYQVLSRAVLVQVSSTPIRYERRLPDGTVEVFTVADRPAGQPNRRIFLTEVIDPQGHAVTLTYDSSVRLVAIADALGQVTTLAYLDSADPLRITRVTDPFGRAAVLTYDGVGRLVSVTDVAGLSSSFTYDAGDFIAAMTTPYGTTTFRHEPLFGTRRIEATDPAGGTERLEYHWSHSELATTSSEVPTGFSAFNTEMHKYNVLYWDKLAMAAGPTVGNAVITSLLLAATDYGGHSWARNLPHSIKRPLESRVWYAYGNTARSAGVYPWPTAIGRVLDGGASQVTTMTYNAQGGMTSKIDPAGRQTTSTYATNGLDVLTVEQVRSGGADIVQSYAGYTNHVPATVTDAAGQTTTMTYNAAGQPLTVTNAKNETTTYAYESVTGNLRTVTGPVPGATTTYTYDAYGRVESTADADGYVVVMDYEPLNRITQRTYPDDTTETYTYSKLSLTEQKDRLGRITRHFYDGFGRRTATLDPAGRTISQVWCDCGSLDALVDANGNRTRWERDIQGRVTREIRADNTTDTLYTYDLAGRLKTVTDPKDQVTTHGYNLDDSLSGTAYTNEVISTPDVSYTYDAFYARVATMVDGIGTTSYTYKAAASNGAGQVASVDGPLSNDTITYTYDELGRVTVRAINGSANTVTWAFDALGRVTSEVNLLGTFTYTYDGVTSRLATVAYPNSQTSTYSYLNNVGDHRLQTLHHKYPSAATLSKFDYTYDAVGNILTWRQQADTTAVLWEYGYDPADQLTSAVKKSTATPATILQRFAYAYDPSGNRTVEQIDDAVTLSAYDTLNRLTSQVPGGPMVIIGALNEAGTVSISGVPVTVDATNNFRGTVPTTTGTNTFTIVAKDATGNATTQQYEVDVAGTGRTLTFDANGNLTTDGDRELAWDARNQLVSVVNGVMQSGFAYDGAGRRVHSTESLSGILVREAIEVWSGLVRQEERDQSGAVTASLSSLGQRVGGVPYFLTADHLNSVRDAVTASGSRSFADSYDPSGRLVRSVSHAIAPRFAGLISAGNGLTSAVFRTYDPSIGAWVSEDPAGFADGLNLYRYVLNSPVGQFDPLGLQGYRKYLPLCVDRVLADGNRISQSGNPRRAHCITTCRLSRECGGNPLASLSVGFWKEVGDTGDCVAGGKQRSCDTAFQPSDFLDNFRGAVCSITSEDCVKACERTTPEGDGPAGPLSRLGRRK